LFNGSVHIVLLSVIFSLVEPIQGIGMEGRNIRPCFEVVYIRTDGEQTCPEYFQKKRGYQ